jgi:hypothetical protein
MVTSENEIRIFFISMYSRTKEQQVIAYGYSVGGAATVASTQSKNYDNSWQQRHFAVDENDFHSGSISSYILREGSSASFSHRSLINDPRMKKVWSLSCVIA